MTPDKIFPRSYMDFEQKYQKDPGMNRVKKISYMVFVPLICVQKGFSLTASFQERFPVARLS